VQDGAKKEWVWQIQQSSAISTACQQMWQILAYDCSLKQECIVLDKQEQEQTNQNEIVK
jgi:hypothetical protein